MTDDEARLIEIGRKFREQQRGRRPGVLSCYVRELVAGLEERTFDALVLELEFKCHASRLTGQPCPVVEVRRDFEFVRYVEKGAAKEASFKRLRNIAQLRK